MDALMDWLVATPVADLMLDYRWTWPIVESLHFSALVLLVGTIGLFDLRVLGLGKGIAPRVVHKLVPIGIGAFGLSILTGLAFISATPDQYFYNNAFYFKVAFLGIAGANVLYFYRGPYRLVSALGPSETAPRNARISAAVSLFAMTGIMLFGRLLTFYRPVNF